MSIGSITMISVKDFYKMICDVFNNGEALPAKFTRKDGYFKMTKGWQHTPGRALPASHYLELCRLVREDAEQLLLAKTEKIRKEMAKRKKKNVKIKYKGD